MCRGRGKKSCAALGTNVASWSNDAPLMPLNWFDGQLTIFAEAVRLAALGRVEDARGQLGSIRSEELQTWYAEHGQQSGVFRNRHFRRPKPAVIVPLDQVKSPDRFAKAVFMRDGYRCRYCGIRLVPKEVLMAFSKIVGENAFRPTGDNFKRHGIVPIFRANADHVLPWTLGGRTDMENLVSCCWCCNYGKSNFTLDQIGVEDPRHLPRIPTSASNGWDGLTSYLPALKANATRRA